jgi:membrane protease YdiL (CAAX protease family)
METEKIKNFKSAAVRITALIVVFFVSAIVCSLTVGFVYVKGVIISESAQYVFQAAMSALFLYGIPIFCGLVLFKKELDFKGLYKKPPRLSKALSNFPAVYGIGQIPNLLMFLIVSIITRFTQQQENMERSFGVLDGLIPPDATCAVIMVVQVVFMAAIFEEFICRGIILKVLRPYGDGFAIVISGFFFGIMHGNFQQFFYTFILGIVWGYITVQTGSILASTILHALSNSIACIMMLFLSTQTVRDYISKDGLEYPTDNQMAVLAGYGMFLAVFAVFLIAGIILAIRRFSRIKRYKSGLVNPFTELGAAKKMQVFFFSVPAAIMFALTADRFAGGVIASKIFAILTG